MKYLKSILAVCVLFAFQNSYSQWTKGKGNGYYKLSAWSLVADQHYTNSGSIDPNATRGNFTLSFYGEYGLSQKLDAITYIPLLTRIYQNSQVSGTNGNVIQAGEAVNSIGDIDVGLRYSLLKNNHFALSTSFKLGLPTGKDKAGGDGSFQTGDGEFNQLLTLDAGISYQFFNKPVYTKVLIGFNNKTQGFSDEFHYGIETGVKFWNKLWVLARLNSVKSFKNGNLSTQNSQGSIFANNIEYVGVGVETAYYITSKLGITLNYTGAISGRIIYARPSISGGVFLDIR
jgi:protein XagA